MGFMHDHRPSPLLCLVLAVVLAVVLGGRSAVAMGEVLARFMRSQGFSDVYAEARTTGTVLGREPSEALVVLLADARGAAVGFTVGQREAVVLAIVGHERNQEPVRARALAKLLFERMDEVEDWTVLSEIVERAVDHGVVGESPRRSAALLTSLAHRLLTALEAASPAGSGYEAPAQALAAAVVVLAGELSSDEYSRATVLAEQLRSITRLSRDRTTVRVLGRATRELLAASRTPPGSTEAEAVRLEEPGREEPGREEPGTN